MNNHTDQKQEDTDQIQDLNPRGSFPAPENTASLKKKSQPPETVSKKKAANYILTINNPEYSLEELAMRLRMNDKVKAFAGQLEKGENGTPHIQLFIQFVNQTWFNSVKLLFPTAHIEQAANAFKSWEYCTKEETRVEGPVTHGPMPKPPLRSK